MSEFKEMLREAFVGEEPFDPSPGRAALEASVRRFESRDRTLRFMMWFAVTFMMLVCVWAAWSFLGAGPEVGTKRLILYAVLFLWGSEGIGWSKMFLFNTQKSLSILKELKRVQLMLERQP